MIVPPTNLTLRDWADQIVYDLSYFGVVARLDDEDWVTWGQGLRNSVAASEEIPDPANFTDWKPWAQRVFEVLS